MTTTKFSLDDMMRKITGLLAVADDPATTDEAAATYRAQAEKLMRKYRIEETELIQSGGLAHEVTKPGSKWIDLCPAESPYYNTYWNIMVYIAQHVGCRIKYKWGTNPDTGVYSLGAMLVGFEADIRFAEVLYQNARIVFADRMEPKVDPSLSDEDNVYRLRSAGIERIKIAKMMGYGDTNSATAKVTNMYKRACKARGEDPALTGRGTSVQAFREAYQQGFTGELWSRLYKARNAADDNSGALVLANRKDLVDEAFYSLFPSERPDKLATRGTVGRRRSGWTKADQARADRLNGAGGLAGKAAGRKAASEIDVNTRSPRKRLND